jgi:hypothetical protein
MANGQFIIPGSLLEAEKAPEASIQPDPQPSDLIAAAPLTPEVQPTQFGFIKDIETRLDSYRETALAIEATKRPWLRSMKSLVLTPKPPLAELIEKESIIGGSLFQKQEPQHELRFWSEGQEWFFGWTNGKDVSITNSTVHYQVSDSHIQKLYQGRVADFAPGEQAHFIQAVTAYEKAVVQQLYPFDQVIQELSNDDLSLAA